MTLVGFITCGSKFVGNSEYRAKEVAINGNIHVSCTFFH